MRKTLRLINQNCRQASQLISQSRDRPLTRLERTGLALHLIGCGNCKRHRKQVDVLDQVAKHPGENSSAVLSAQARKRISERLTVAAGDTAES